MVFSNNKVYDVLKWIALIGLPALITFYGVLGATCNIPYTEQVLTIATAFNAMIGTWLGISNVKYKKFNIPEETKNEN